MESEEYYKLSCRALETKVDELEAQLASCLDAIYQIASAGTLNEVCSLACELVASLPVTAKTNAEVLRRAKGLADTEWILLRENFDKLCDAVRAAREVE